MSSAFNKTEWFNNDKCEYEPIPQKVINFMNDLHKVFEKHQLSFDSWDGVELKKYNGSSITDHVDHPKWWEN